GQRPANGDEPRGEARARTRPPPAGAGLCRRGPRRAEAARVKPLLALALVALLVAPSALAVRAPLPYAQPLRDLAPKIVARVASLQAEAGGALWWPDAATWLARAKSDSDAGRFHATLYDAETLVEVVRAHQLQDDTNKTANTVGDQRAFVAQRALAWRAESNDTWLAFRAKLHQTDGAVRSVAALEYALFAADLGAGAKVGDAE